MTLFFISIPLTVPRSLVYCAHSGIVIVYIILANGQTFVPILDIPILITICIERSPVATFFPVAKRHVRLEQYHDADEGQHRVGSQPG